MIAIPQTNLLKALKESPGAQHSAVDLLGLEADIVAQGEAPFSPSKVAYNITILNEVAKLLKTQEGRHSLTVIPEIRNALCNNRDTLQKGSMLPFNEAYQLRRELDPIRAPNSLSCPELVIASRCYTAALVNKPIIPVCDINKTLSNLHTRAYPGVIKELGETASQGPAYLISSDQFEKIASGFLHLNMMVNHIDPETEIPQLNQGWENLVIFSETGMRKFFLNHETGKWEIEILGVGIGRRNARLIDKEIVPQLIEEFGLATLNLAQFGLETKPGMGPGLIQTPRDGSYRTREFCPLGILTAASRESPIPIELEQLRDAITERANELYGILRREKKFGHKVPHVVFELGGETTIDARDRSKGETFCQQIQPYHPDAVFMVIADRMQKNWENDQSLNNKCFLSIDVSKRTVYEKQPFTILLGGKLVVYTPDSAEEGASGNTLRQINSANRIREYLFEAL